MKTRIYTMQVTSPWYADTKFCVPDLCPNCGVSNNPTNRIEGFFNSGNSCILALLSHRCPSCGKYHWTLQNLYGNKQDPEMLFVYPSVQLTSMDSKIVSLSPRFEKMYHSAERSENIGDYDLAGMGYRAALEILIKDYAVQFTNESKDKIAGYKLNDAIAHFYKNEQTAQVSADVVRIYGNDYAHWDQPDQFNSEEILTQLKAYLRIFTSWIGYQLMIANPPVSREDKNSKK